MAAAESGAKPAEPSKPGARVSIIGVEPKPEELSDAPAAAPGDAQGSANAAALSQSLSRTTSSRPSKPLSHAVLNDSDRGLDDLFNPQDIGEEQTGIENAASSVESLMMTQATLGAVYEEYVSRALLLVSCVAVLFGFGQNLMNGTGAALLR